MKKVCPFESECGISPDMIPITGVCSDGLPGSVCGPAIAFDGVLDRFKGMEAEDVVSPIQAVAEVIREPVIRTRQHPDMGKQMVGLSFPVRQSPEEVKHQWGIEISYEEVFLSILAQGKPILPESTPVIQFEGSTRALTNLPWEITLDRCETVAVNNMSSVEFYGQFLSSDVKEQLSNKLFLTN